LSSLRIVVCEDIRVGIGGGGGGVDTEELVEVTGDFFVDYDRVGWAVCCPDVEVRG